MDKMLLQSLRSHLSSQGLQNLTFDPKLTVSRSKNAAGVDHKPGVHHKIVHTQALKFGRLSFESPASICLGELLCQPLQKRQGAKNRSMAGDAMPPHPAAPSYDSPGASSTSKLEDGDGVVIVDHGSRRAESNAMLHEFVKMYKEETGNQFVEAAHMELATPTIADAFDRCVEQGATRIIICPYFLFPGRHWNKDIPALAAEAAKKHPGVSYLVTAPIGLHKLMVTVIQDRMEYCLSQVAGEASECDMCKGTGRCKQLVSPESHSTTDTLGRSIGTLAPK